MPTSPSSSRRTGPTCSKPPSPPGRIDLAVEIGLPDAAALRRLIELFGRGLDLRLDSMDSIVAKTNGVAASLVKELLRKAAAMAADEDNGSGRLVVTDAT
jgi:ATP-dependent 26S proteasome regulatory subunit